MGVRIRFDSTSVTQRPQTATPSGAQFPCGRPYKNTTAEFERSMIRQRVRDGLSVIKAKIERDGKFVSKAGNVRIRLGRPGAEADKLDRAREELAKGTGIIKTAKLIGLAGEESTLAIEGYRSDGAFDRIGVDLDAAMGRHSGAQCGCRVVALDQAQGPGKRDFAVEAMPLAGWRR